MIYGYIRVSTDKQTVENQRFEINNWCEKKGMVINGWIEDEAISGTKDYRKRNLGKLLKKAKKEDIIICSELSRLGRNLFMIMEILNYCMEKDIRVHTIKDGYRLGDDIQSKVLAFAFGLSAEIERNLISQRTKEALARKRAEGTILGRPVGRKSTKMKLTGKEKEIQSYLDKGISYSTIAKLVGVHRLTVSSYVKNRMDEDGNAIEIETYEREEIARLEPQRAEIVSMYLEEGKTMQQIAKYFTTKQIVISIILRGKCYEKKKNR